MSKHPNHKETPVEQYGKYGVGTFSIIVYQARSGNAHVNLREVEQGLQGEKMTLDPVNNSMGIGNSAGEKRALIWSPSRCIPMVSRNS